MKAMNRREMLAHTGLAALTLGLFPSTLDAALLRRRKRKVLFFSKSSGYEHDVIKRVNGQPSFVEKLLQQWGPEENVEFTFSKDGSLFNPDYLHQFDAYFFYTTGDLTQAGNDKNPPMTPEGKKAFLDAIHKGKGFIGTHSATDTFHSPYYANRATMYKNDPPGQRDPYIDMIGGEFIIHGAQQHSLLVPTDRHFPGLKQFPDDFGPVEEWYTLKNFASNLHVLLIQDTKGMQGPMYNRPPYPSTWARFHGRGRVFYTNMGHREDIWTNPVFKQVLFGGIHWATHTARARVHANIEKVTPQASQTPTAA
jgi:uncharacterized protein